METHLLASFFISFIVSSFWSLIAEDNLLDFLRRLTWIVGVSGLLTVLYYGT